MQDCEDKGVGKKGSSVLSGDILPLLILQSKMDLGDSLEGGVFTDLSRYKWLKPYCEKCGLHSFPIEQVPEESRDIILEVYKNKYKVFHGQEVVCEGRLHFDQDMKRANDGGPWPDGIPFDGRDIWQFTLIFDDTKASKWVLKPDSLINLGRDRHPRCWPWSNEMELPYTRDGVDRYVPIGTPWHHLCIGPFGCNGNDHPHQYDDGGAA
eukprot:CAMPEP_0168804986 /NCGR_PEP_ID=MMETSP0726-20121227/798_1 /TAXON_ID=265536 /ORGANISM="Amphiprora sp., Strain CCMP467" /LENGTH=208 /DNA_ID=CAMNT_0008856847 /DNA_START=117 /DNA_END=743 /DNA_ORIENTATION=-